MKTIRLYYPKSYQENASLELSDDAFHHAIKVLRCRKGDKVQLFDGTGTKADAEILSVERRTATLLIKQVKAVNRESPLKTTLVQTVSKGERMDFVLQKASELGVHRIQPLITERCNVKLDSSRWEKRQQHWQRVIISACEQSGRNQLPQLLPVIRFNDLLENSASTKKSQWYILQPERSQTLAQLNIDNNQAVTFIIGSEGGFSDDEIKRCLQAGITAVTLGPRILRTETSALTVLAIAQALWGDV